MFRELFPRFTEVLQGDFYGVDQGGEETEGQGRGEPLVGDAGMRPSRDHQGASGRLVKAVWQSQLRRRIYPLDRPRRLL